MKKPKIVANLCQKGGPGKSTLAIHLAYEWTHFLGLRVVLFDRDPKQQSLMAWDRVRADKKAVPPVVSGLNKSVQKMLADAKQQFGEFDVALIDTRGHDSDDAAVVAAAADAILVPMTPASLFDTDALGITVSTIKACNKMDKALVILNKCRPYIAPFEHPTVTTARTTLKNGYGLDIAETAINYYYGIEDTLGKGTTITSSTPSSPGARQFRALAKELSDKIGLNGV